MFVYLQQKIYLLIILCFIVENIPTTSCSCDEKIESTKESISSSCDC